MNVCQGLTVSHGRPRGLFYLAKQLRVERIALAQHNAKSRSAAQLKHAETCWKHLLKDCFSTSFFPEVSVSDCAVSLPILTIQKLNTLCCCVKIAFPEQQMLPLSCKQLPGESASCARKLKTAPQPNIIPESSSETKNGFVQSKQWGGTTRRRMARERRGAGSSVVSIETLYYKTIY